MGMCPEVFEIVQKMDLSKVETRLALQCASVITGIKMSNLLTASSVDEKRIYEIFKGTEIQYYCLYRQEEKTTYLLFRITEFVAYLQKPNVQHVLEQAGYHDLTIVGVLKIFQSRYISYMRYRKGFPHEMGLLLGYPIEDVQGFIKNKGKNYLYAGYWKVYEDVEEKKLLFDAYESAKEGLLLLVANGYSIRPIIERFQDDFIY